MPLTSPGNDDDTGENHQPTLRKNTAEPVEQTLKQNSQLYRSWQLKELLRTLLKHPLEQARGELRHWVFRASHSRIPEIVEPAKKIRRRRPDILRTIQLGYSNARLEAFNNRIKVTIRMAYGFHRVTNLIALIMLRCGGLDIRLPQPTI
ncbi:MAG: ISL3 family transposase [Bifidobacterium longum]